MSEAAPAGRGGHAATTAPVRVYLSAGSNVEPLVHLRRAVTALRALFGPLTLSSVYRSRSAGFAGEDFLNLVIGFDTTASPQAIVAELERLHREAERVRTGNPFSPRTLDLDLVLYGDLVSADLRLSHPDVVNYSFVLGPLAEIAPGLRHPGTGETIAEMWRRFDKTVHPLECVGAIGP